MTSKNLDISSWNTLYSVEWYDERWMMDWSGYGRKRSWPKSRYYPYMCLQELRRTTGNLNQASRCPGRDSNRSFPEYHFKLLPLCQPARCIFRSCNVVSKDNSVFVCFLLREELDFLFRCLAYCWALKKESFRTSEPSVNFYRSTRRHVYQYSTLFGGNISNPKGHKRRA